ncbi:MAG: hypothetical protein JXA50_07320 [Deltaproteobacteria bacterium]|nr:hypothetical protein [Deltaproteobacteria bacterium]
MAKKRTEKGHRAKNQDDNTKVENWRIQLGELNARSRMYATQLWALPFLYLTAIGVVLSFVEDACKLNSPIASTLSALGILVFTAMIGTRHANDRVVQWIAKVEKRLGLPQTVQVRHNVVDWSYYSIVLVAVAVMSFFATQQLITKTWLRAAISLSLVILGVITAAFNGVKSLEESCPDP